MTKMVTQDDQANETRGVLALAFGVFVARLLQGTKGSV